MLVRLFRSSFSALSLVSRFRPNPNSMPLVGRIRRFVSRTGDLDASKEFARDTILYQVNNLPRLRLYQAGALLNFCIWGYGGGYAMRYLGSISVEDEERIMLERNPNVKDTTGYNWWKAVSTAERKYHVHIAVLFGLIGYLTAMIVGLFSARSVNTLIIRKGGTHGTILTSRAVSISKLREITVPLSHITCKMDRHAATSYITLKIKGHPLYFLVDTKGTFYNSYLFDRTFGMQRNLKHA